jgi:murein DD-endopeptidase MepM/ murein hydrolase activator NlpD
MKKHLPEWTLGILFFFLLIFSVSRLMWYNYMIPQTGPDIEIPEPELLYGLPVDSFHVEENSVERNQNLSDILLSRGVSPIAIDKIARNSNAVFDVRKMKVGNDYAVFYSKDSLREPLYFVYREDPVHYYLYELSGDSLKVKAEQYEMESRRSVSSGVITSSLWKTLEENNLDPMMAIRLSEIYQWTIDFYGIQKGDWFKVIYDEDFVKGESIGTGKIHAALFSSGGHDFYAFYFEQEDGESYFDEKGQSLRKSFLKSPLKFAARISSRFSNSRMHPILRIRRPHHGVDYAAPTGTPVYSIGNGVVLTRAYQGGGGNFIKIRHNSVYTTTYMHLSKFAAGIATGTRVKQGDLIGYVGSTGLSSGPHLDFRVFMNGIPVDPLKMKSEPAEPVSEANRNKFNALRDSFIKELKKEVKTESVKDTAEINSTH